MANDENTIYAPDNFDIKIIKWRVRENFPVNNSQVILHYVLIDSNDKEIKRLKANKNGVAKKRLHEDGATVRKGAPLLELCKCIHTTVIKDMCADCGADLRRNENQSTEASVPMIHSIPDLKVTQKLAQKLGQADTKRLLEDKKLVLLVDLDQTLIHTTNDNVPNNIKGIYHFQLYGPNSIWYHTRLRPRTLEFLNNIAPFFELHICTFGARNYAHMIAQILDPDGKFFSNRILSRDECFNVTCKTDNLKALFPCGDSMVCIIDDREDVWNMASNLIQVKPYHFFQHTGDINAPPGLSKHELDGKGVDFKDLSKIIPNDVKSEDANSNKESNNELTKEDEKTDENNLVQTNPANGMTKIIKNNTIKTKENSKATTRENQQNDKDIKVENCEASIETNTVNEVIDNDLEEGVNKIKCETEENITVENNIEEKHSNFTSVSNCIRHSSQKLDDNPEEIPNNELKEENNVENVCDVTEIKDEGKKQQELLSSSSSSSSSSEKTSEKMQINKTTENSEILTKENEFIEIEDTDDYLLYLETILMTIHRRFYEIYDQQKIIPDLKILVPQIRSKVLEGLSLVFSGLIPYQVKLEQSRAYLIARSLGAEITQHLNDQTTHLVAVVAGTFKYYAARKRKDIIIVTPDWLWCCAERWEKVDEKLFPLDPQKPSKMREPPAHCHSPEHVINYSEYLTNNMQSVKPEPKFMDTINPLLSFSNADLAEMNQEFDQFFESDTSSEDEHVNIEIPPVDKLFLKRKREQDDEERPLKFFSRPEVTNTLIGKVPEEDMEKNVENDEEQSDDSADDADDEDDDEPLSVKFRRGEDLPSDLDIGSESQGSENTIDDDDGEWNMMGAALEREFLGLEE